MQDYAKIVAVEAIRAHVRTGQPLGGAKVVARLEKHLGRKLAKAKPSPKPKSGQPGANSLFRLRNCCKIAKAWPGSKPKGAAPRN